MPGPFRDKPPRAVPFDFELCDSGWKILFDRTVYEIEPVQRSNNSRQSSDEYYWHTLFFSISIHSDNRHFSTNGNSCLQKTLTTNYYSRDQHVKPPSMTIDWPVMNCESSEVSNLTVPIISSTVPRRPSGVLRKICSFCLWGMFFVMSVTRKPGNMAFTRTFTLPISRARLFVKPTKAAFDAL